MHCYSPTRSQRLIWLDQAASEGSAKYNIGGYAVLEGELVYEAFNEAVVSVLRNQEAYATVFVESDGELTCVVKEISSGHTVPLLDFTTGVDPEAEAMRWMEEDFARPFVDLDSYLFHFVLLKVRETKYFWYAKIHHLIGDGYSFQLLLNQAAIHYSARSLGQPAPGGEYRYSDYAAEDKVYYDSKESIQDKEFWLNELSTLPASVVTPIRFGEEAPGAGSETLRVGVDDKERLQALAEQNKVSLFHVIVGLILLYFGRTGGQERIIMGIPVLNRTKKAYRQTSGVFMNLLAIPFELPADRKFASLLAGIKQKMSAVLRHQRYQYGNLVRDLKKEAGRNLLYDIRISYEDFDFMHDFGGLNASAVALSNYAEIDPLAIYIREYHGRGFDIRFIYNTSFFTKERILSLRRGISCLISQVSGKPDLLWNELDILHPDEKARIIAAGSGPVRNWPDKTYIMQWERAVSDHPDRIAVSCGDRYLTYRQADLASRKIAGALVRLSLPLDHVNIALLLDRSEYMVVAMIGSLLAGRCYIPIDPQYPEQRIAYMLRDSKTAVVLTDGSYTGDLSGLTGLTMLNVEEILTHSMNFPSAFAPVRPGSACYMIYTSGSTGEPKGVLISQESLADYVASFADHFKLTMEDVVLQQASVSFDTSVEEIFPILAVGGRLHIWEDRKDFSALQQVMCREGVSILSTNPWVIRFLRHQTLPASLRVIISGGDVLKREHIAGIGHGIEIFNTYGPTESTVCATYHKVSGDDEDIPIGTAIPNRRLYVLDHYGHLQPFGVEGEIHIAGKGLAMGYFGRPGLTEERFVPDLLMAGERMYRTGDRGVLREDGALLFRGRLDEQVNFRGYRIEVKEIEAAIQAQNEGVDCLVEVRELNGVPLLTAYVLYPDEAFPHSAVWKRNLARKLPAYMIPEAWIRVKEFPLLPSGKIDRRSLPAMGSAFEEAAEGKSSPQLPEEFFLQGIWTAILQRDHIGIDDNFFESGGHSLNIIPLLTAIKDKFGVDVRIHDLFEHDTIRKQAAFLSQAPILDVETSQNLVENDRSITPTQLYIWILSQLKEASLAYHISGALRMRGRLSMAALRQATEMIVSRHDILHTIFVETEQEVVRKEILDPVIIADRVFRFYRRGEYNEDINLALSDIVDEPFDLAKGPLIRLVLLEISEEDYLFTYVIHHVISDGWSMEVLLRELVGNYNALVEGNPVDRMPVRMSLQNEGHFYRKGDLYRKDAARAYWAERFSGAIPRIDLPAQRMRPLVKTYRGKRIVKNFDDAHYRKMQQFCMLEGTTVFTALLATLNALIYRYTGQGKTVIGAPVADREGKDAGQRIGVFLNMLPIITAFDGDYSFRELLHLQQRVFMEAFPFHRYPLHELLKDINYRQDPGRSPLFDILIVLHNQQTLGYDKEEMKGVELENFQPFPSNYSQFDMSFSFFYDGDSLQLRLDYNTDLFDEWFAEQIAGHFIGLSLEGLKTPDCPIADLSYFTPKLPDGGSLSSASGDGPGTDGKVWLDCLSRQASLEPDRTAVVSEHLELSYAEVLHDALRTAKYLIDKKNLRAGERVAVLMEPDHRFPSCVLGIWLAGGVYVSVNMDYPEARRQWIMDDAGCRVVFDAKEWENIEAYEPQDLVWPERSVHLSYILYTSGSTGRPKGVAVSHAALYRKLYAELGYILPGSPVSSALLTNYSFDVFFLELLLPLMTGGKVFIVSRDLKAKPERLGSLLADEGINVLHGTPGFMDSLLRYLPDPLLDRLDKTLQLICLGGESLYGKLVEFLRDKLPAVQINNHYGPTEAVIHAIVYPGIRIFDKNIIGRAMPGTRVYIADSRLQLQPPGIPGEILIGGELALADGYINMPEETARQFISSPWSGGEKVYKTGDIGRWTKEDDIEFMGRFDDQVKIRGMRVELDEIKAFVERYPAIDQAVVIPRHSGEHLFLVAYCVSGSAPDESGLRGYLRQFLPDYMVPAVYEYVREIPLNKNGKVDRDALAQQTGFSVGSNKNMVVPPRNELDRKLIRIWEEVLNRSPVGIRCNFYDLGGNSILLIRLRAELKREMNVHLNVRDLLSMLTIEALSDGIAALDWVRQHIASSGELPEEEFTL